MPVEKVVQFIADQINIQIDDRRSAFKKRADRFLVKLKEVSILK